MSTQYETVLNRAAEIVTNKVATLPIGAILRYPDITLMLAKNGVVLSAAAMTELVQILVTGGFLARITKQKLMKPLVVSVAPKTDLNMEQRMAMMEAQLRDLSTQVAALSNRLL